MSLTGKDMKRRVWLLWDIVAQLGEGRGEERFLLPPLAHHFPCPWPFLTFLHKKVKGASVSASLVQAQDVGGLSKGRVWSTHLSRALAMSRKPRADVLFRSHRIVLGRR